MKKIKLLLLTFLASSGMLAQDITGQWNGVLKIQGMQLKIVFHIIKTDSGYSSTMDSPDQNVKGIQVTSTSFENLIVKLEIANLKIEYKGTFDKEDTITGNFKQVGQSFAMNLSRNKLGKEKLNRPQEPTQPYSYYSEDITFENKNAGIFLAGTLTLPKKEGNYPVVVLISGSGPQNRNEELLGHKPFLVLADYLTNNGIAVLRFDDRGIGASKGNFKTATTLDFSTDVEAAVKYLQTRKEINQKKIGLIGHSEGGIIAPMVAAKNKNIAFIVLLAGPGIPTDKLLLLQQESLGKAAGIGESDLKKMQATNRGAYDIVMKSTDSLKLKTELTDYFKQMLKNNPDAEIPKGTTADKYVNSLVKQLTNPWLQYFIKYDPAINLEKIKCPVLALNGEKDLQVPAKINLDAIRAALIKGGNKKFTIKEIPNLNHLFQECKTGLPAEYEKIEQTFSPIALTEILNWLQIQIK